MIDSFFELFSHTFIQRMFAASILASISCGIIGSLVVVKRIVFVSGGIAHATFGGIGLAYFLQYTMGWIWLEPLIGAVLFAVGTAIIMSVPLIKQRLREDSTIGVIWVVGMALGVLFINPVDRNIIQMQDPISILFGNILLVQFSDLLIMVLLVIVILIVSMLLFKDLKILTFDEEFAQISGINVVILNLVIFVIMMLVLGRLLINPLMELASGAEKISRGDLNQTFDVSARDEIGYLATTFNKMQSSLRVAIRRLTKTAGT